MIRATTPTHIFTFPSEVNPSECAEIQITYAQNSEHGCHNFEHIILEKNKEDTTISGQKVMLDLTQEELNLFKPGVAQIQVRAKNQLDKVMASQILNVKVKPVLNKEIL